MPSFELPAWLHGVLILARLPFYAALLVLVAAVACAAWIELSGFCQEMSGVRIACDTPGHTRLATIVFGVFMIYSFGVFPTILALAGAVLLVVDVQLVACWVAQCLLRPWRRPA